MIDRKLEPGDIVDVYATTINSDGSEGRGHNIFISYFWYSADAALYGKGKDVMGSDGKVTRLSGVVDKDRRVWVNGHVVDVCGDLRDARRETARAKLRDAKLTVEELDLLQIPKESR